MAEMSDSLWRPPGTWFGGTGLRLAAASLLLAAASAVTMALLYQPGYDPTRVYDGTDTRAFALLIGSALAFVWPSRHLRGGVTKGARWVLDGAGVAGLAVFAVLVWRTSEYSPFLYRGGMVLRYGRCRAAQFGQPDWRYPQRGGRYPVTTCAHGYQQVPGIRAWPSPHHVPGRGAHRRLHV